MESGLTYVYALGLETKAGFEILGSQQVTVAAPVVSRLLGNHPDPFNPWTLIRFELAHADVVRILVFDIRGRFIRELVSSALPTGTHELVWDGRDVQGRPVSSGVYLYEVRSTRWSSRERMTLVR